MSLGQYEVERETSTQNVEPPKGPPIPSYPDLCPLCMFEGEDRTPVNYFLLHDDQSLCGRHSPMPNPRQESGVCVKARRLNHAV
jgi:hypothetical protein